MAAVVEPMAADPAKHRGELIERLDSLRRNERFCDVTVLVAVKDKEFNKRTSVRPSTNRLAEFCMVHTLMNHCHPVVCKTLYL